MQRGNHETKNMNKIYGFEGEVKHKYDDTVMNLFTEVGIITIPMTHLVAPPSSLSSFSILPTL